jgi:tRNA pseudouridine13 synthase
VGDGGWLPPLRERALGLDFYATDTPGVSGALKIRPDDFRVREISAYPRPDAQGAFTVLRLETEDWEQHELAQRLASRLGLAPHALAWAGTKDRRAVSERLFSYRGAPPEDPAVFDLPRVRLREAYRARDGLVLGHHYGNIFDIRLGRVEAREPEAVARAEATRDALRRRGTFPNFFGPQRFGEVRPVTHAVGRHLVRGDPASALDAYLVDRPPEDPTGLGAEARRSYEGHRDPRRALREFPAALGFERRLLERLARGDDAARAFTALPRELRMLFVHAYQALLFNRYLGERRARGLSDTVPEPGDRLLRVARDGTVPGRDPIPVTEDNLAEARELAGRLRAHLAGPLVGFSTPLEDGRPGQALRAVLDAEAVRPEDFRLRVRPDLASRGTWRPLAVPVPPIGLSASEAPSAESDTEAGGPTAPALRFVFALPKGVYATVLLREFLKDGAVREKPADPASPALASSGA